MNKEPLLNIDEERLVIFPIKYPDLWQMYKKQRSSFWTPDEIDFSKDIDDWLSLTNDEQYFIQHILAFFAGSDGIVSTNINLNFNNEVKILEANFVYDFQCMMEDIHAETYSIMIDNYIKDVEKKDKLFNGIETIPCIRKKAEWSMKWIKNVNEPFAKRLIAFAIVEGVFFSGSFCAIYWLKQRNLLSGLTISNELISRDEGMHCDFACMLYSMIIDKIDEETVHLMFKEALDIEKEFIVDSLPCKLIGMNSTLMCQYLEFVTDRLLVQLGYNKIYKASNPFSFMDAICLQGKTNFFEHRVSQYQKAKINDIIISVNNTLESSTMQLLEDF
jgi:ribonucleoside-diphosphate reductase beta chain